MILVFGNSSAFPRVAGSTPKWILEMNLEQQRRHATLIRFLQEEKHPVLVRGNMLNEVNYK